MSMLSSAQLTKMRADVAKTLPDTCEIQRKTGSVDAYGNPPATWGTAEAAAACRLDPYSGQGDLVKALDRETSFSLYQLTLTDDVDIQYGDRVVLDSTTYEVQQLSPSHSWRVSTRAIVAYIQTESD